jgi:hypothetical protein
MGSVGENKKREKLLKQRRAEKAKKKAKYSSHPKKGGNPFPSPPPFVEGSNDIFDVVARQDYERSQRKI